MPTNPTSFIRGSLFFSRTNNNIYLLTRESRPAEEKVFTSTCGCQFCRSQEENYTTNKHYFFNLINLSNGKARVSDSDPALNGPDLSVKADTLFNRFADLDLVYIGDIQDSHITDVVMDSFEDVPVSTTTVRLGDLRI